VRVIDLDGSQVGILPVGEALTLARLRGVDLVEVAPNADPPVCRVVDYGKFRYEQAKKEKESKKHQTANQLKEIQLSARIDPHDLGMKAARAIDFLCEDMKLKVVLRFRGREMAHTEVGFDVVRQFLEKVAPYGHADFNPRLNGRAIVVMVSPLPRNKRAKHPGTTAAAQAAAATAKPGANAPKAPPPQPPSQNFTNNPFAQLDGPGK